jgi:hypothetical protein
MAKTPEEKRKNPADGRIAYMQIRLTDAEKEAFETAARLSGLALSAWARTGLRRLSAQELQAAGKPVKFLD